jgi:hypothetical protein
LRELALSSGWLIVSPECRLVPEHPFPAAVEDALAVARWLNAEAPALGAAPAAPAVAGDSSGGNLAAIVTHALTRESVPPSFRVLIYPMLDATASSASYDEFASGYGFSSEKSRWYFDQYLPPGLDRRTPRVSPLFDRGLGDLPATLIVTAECDPLRDEGEHHAASLRDAGVEVELRRYQGMIHGFFQMTGALAGSRRLHRELGEWMRWHADRAPRAHSPTRLRADKTRTARTAQTVPSTCLTRASSPTGPAPLATRSQQRSRPEPPAEQRRAERGSGDRGYAAPPAGGRGSGPRGAQWAARKASISVIPRDDSLIIAASASRRRRAGGPALTQAM